MSLGLTPVTVFDHELTDRKRDALGEAGPPTAAQWGAISYAVWIPAITVRQSAP